MTQLEMFEDVIFEVILKKKKILSPACLLGWESRSPVLLPGLQIWDRGSRKLVNMKR